MEHLCFFLIFLYFYVYSLGLSLFLEKSEGNATEEINLMFKKEITKILGNKKKIKRIKRK